MRIGLLTGGGDCPGLNAAIRAVVRVAAADGDEIVGFHHGWRGVVEGDGSVLTTTATAGILQCGGTILRTARYHPDEHDGGVAAVIATVERERLSAVIAIGGDGTLASSSRLAHMGVPIVGIPKTIDNDVRGTRACIGFDTAVATAADAIDRVHTTGESHDRLMVVEVMGRTVGWLAVCAGIAAGADAILLPEVATDLDALAKAIRRRHDTGSTSSVVVVAEGASFDVADAPVGCSTGAVVASELEQRTGFETRLTVLGHVQRGGSPTATDRVLATSFGVAAIEAVHRLAFGSMVSVIEEDVTLARLDDTVDGPRPVPPALLDVASRLTVQW
jgi:6-phosphofructokinase 1